ncbi:MAG: hybrid sensor histidine kinase/response regulator, partial [Hyphomicrobiaceae bacterium]
TPPKRCNTTATSCNPLSTRWQGLAVFDRDMRLVCWNRQFRELLDLPAELGRVGMPLDRIVRAALERSGIAASRLDTAIADHIYRLAVDKGTFQQSFASNRVLEVRTSPMPQGGIVATYSDITERVIAAEELARANESLERRVNDRTAQLTAANEALAIAKSKADAAYQEKTRFIAAASHDILQPLNAARLYATSLVERQLAGKEAVLARNIDASLEAVEEILGALIDISRLDSNRMEPELTTFPLAEIFERLGVEFEPMARSKGLDFKIVATSAWVRSDRRLMRRVLQNLVSNAIKYTQAGKVLLGVRRKGSQIVVQVSDNGPGIAPANHPLIFKEFRRLDETAGQERGLGLGLSIVERIGRVLDHPVQVISDVGRGATFTVTMPAAPRLAEATAHLRRPSAATRLSGCITLCIDNEPAVIDSMRGLLQGWGCQVVVADSADKAIAACAEGRTTPHVILADYHLDSGTGIEAIAAIRQALAIAAPAIIITADHSLEVQREVKAAGHHLLRKPLKTAALRSLLMQVTLQRLAAE